MSNQCTHQGEKTIIVTEAFAMHERTVLKCCSCLQIIPDDGGELALQLLKNTFKNQSKIKN